MIGVRASILLALVGSCALPVGAQSRPATDAPGGTVRDAASAPIAGATVRLEGRDTLVMRTDARGAWQAPRSIDGTYVLSVRAIGFRPFRSRAALTLGSASTAAIETVLEPAALALDQTVITAARRAQRLGDAVTTVEVVSRADLERTGASDLASVLTEQTGIELQGGHPAGTGVMLQGFGSERVLILLDGQPVAGRISGVFDISRIPVAMVERVEVVKGAQSTLYGSEAMGGVVNIITRTPLTGTLGATATATAGTQDRRDGSARLTAGRGALSGAFDLSRRRMGATPGLDADASAGALAARVDGAAKLRWNPDSSRQVEMSLLALDERQRWRSGTYYNFGDNVQVSGRVSASFARGAHRLSPGAWSSHYDHRSRASTQSLPIAGDTGQRQLQRVHQFELLYAGRFGPRLAVDAGTQVRIDEIETARVPGGLRSFTSVEPFAQLELAPTARLTLLPGVRLSQSTQWGSYLTPRVALRAALSDRLTLRASLGNGFRAPDFKELYLFFQNGNANYAVQGNPDLRPESSRNAMLGAEWAAGGGYVRGQLFHNRFRDFIETRAITAPGAPPVYQYANVDDGTTRGLELESGVNFDGRGRLRLEGSVSLLATRDEATGRSLLGRPTESARLLVGGTLPFALRLSVGAVHTGRTAMQRDATTGEVSSWREAFTRVDVRLARTLPIDGVEFVLGADNLFDRRPADWAGFTGRHLYTSLSWSLTRTTVR